MTTKRTLSIPEASQELGIGRSSAYEAARRGELPTIRIGHRLLVPRAALDRMLGEEDYGNRPSDRGGQEADRDGEPE